MDAPFKIDVNKSDTETNIAVSGDLIINHIEKIKEGLDNSIDFSKNLTLDLNGITSIDITFIQLIISLKKSFQSSAKQIVFKNNFNDEIKTLLQNAGFNNLF
ncbi:STAS domain-containing protein [Saccharicrinis aurantiacus]|uniref:STAS domain-containing protein n=1 Tax=Saccharicrinis aurantiacus TaxID=1849719 RepID=UPI0024907983|nr:STAS domain-containing protein [Saccharicrinis aurantiacus]